jgi:hypothetical protein
MNTTYTLQRLSAAANSITRARNGKMWRDDLVQECALAILEGKPLRLDRTGLSWVMNGLLDKWMGTRRSLINITAVAKEMTCAPPLASDIVELKEICAIATAAERKALLILATEGIYRHDGARKRERQRDSQALYNLRRKLSDDR